MYSTEIGAGETKSKTQHCKQNNECNCATITVAVFEQTE
jgi:hypothetical protein